MHRQREAGGQRLQGHWRRQRQHGTIQCGRGRNEPSRSSLRPRPNGLSGRAKTSMDRTSPGLRRCSACSAASDAQLNSSEPQNRMRSGSEALALTDDDHLPRGLGGLPAARGLVRALDVRRRMAMCRGAAEVLSLGSRARDAALPWFGYPAQSSLGGGNWGISLWSGVKESSEDECQVLRCCPVRL